MAAGLRDKLYSFEEIIHALDLVAPKDGRPKSCKKRDDLGRVCQFQALEFFVEFET